VEFGGVKYSPRQSAYNAKSSSRNYSLQFTFRKLNATLHASNYPTVKLEAMNSNPGRVQYQEGTTAYMNECVVKRGAIQAM